MSDKKSYSLKINVLVAAIGLVLASSAYAGNDRDKNHVEASNHGVNHIENDSQSVRDSHSASGKIKLKSYLTAVDEPLAYGEVKLEQKTSKSEFSAEIKLPIPSAALAVNDATGAADATLNLLLTDSQGLAYAECSLDLKEIKTASRSRRGGANTLAEYKVEIKSRNGYLQEQYGVCDIDLSTAGIQSGVPLIQYGDSVEVTIDTNNAIVVQGGF